MNRSARMTFLLALMLLSSMAVALLSYLHLGKRHDDARVAHANLVAATRDLDEIRRWKQSPTSVASVSMDTALLTSRLRQAANAAGLADAPGIEPYNPTRIGTSDYTQTLVSFRFEPLSVRQLTLFLLELSRIDPSARAKTIELAPPDSASAQAKNDDLWTADVAIAYLQYSPQKK